MHESYETIQNLQLNISKIMPTRQKTPTLPPYKYIVQDS